MTKETLKKIETLIAKFNRNHIGSYDDVALLIEVNSGMLDRAVEAKMELFKILNDLKQNGYVVNMTITHDGFISSVSYVK